MSRELLRRCAAGARGSGARTPGTPGRRGARSPRATRPPIRPHRTGRQTSLLRDVAQRRQVLDRLVGRAVFAQADRIVRVDVDRVRAHQRAHAHRVARVVAEDQERRVVRNEAAVQREAVADRGHREFAHAVIDVVGVGVVAGDRLAALPHREVGMRRGRPSRRSVPAAAARTRRSPSARPCATRRPGRRPAACAMYASRIGGELVRQFAARAAHEFVGDVRMRVGVARRTAGPTGARAPGPHRARATPGGCRRESRTAHAASPMPRASRRLRPCPAPRRGWIPCPPCSANRSRSWSWQQTSVGLSCDCSADSIAALIASLSWPSTPRITFHP